MPTARNHWIEKYLKRTEQFLDLKFSKQNSDLTQTFEDLLEKRISKHETDCKYLSLIDSINDFMQKQSLRQKYIFVFDRKITKNTFYKLFSAFLGTSAFGTFIAYVLGLIG